MKERGASMQHQWDPALYNCQHYAGDCISTIAPGVRQFYTECLMHKPNLLKLTDKKTTGLAKLAARVSQLVKTDKTPDLDGWQSLFDKQRPGPEWTIVKVELYWEDCTIYAATLTTKENRASDHSEMHQNMKMYRKQKALEEQFEDSTREPTSIDEPTTIGDPEHEAKCAPQCELCVAQ